MVDLLLKMVSGSWFGHSDPAQYAASIELLDKNTLYVKAEPVTVGRDPAKCQIILDDPTVSRVHCQLLRFHGAWAVADLDSKAGTLVIRGKNEYYEPVQKPVELRNGDLLELGKTTLKVVFTG